MAERFLEFLAQKINSHRRKGEEVTKVTIENEKGDKLEIFPDKVLDSDKHVELRDQESVYSQEQIMSFKKARELSVKSVEQVLSELPTESVTDWGNAFLKLIEDLRVFIDQQISKLDQTNIKTSIRIRLLDSLMQGVLKLNTQLIDKRGEILSIFDNSENQSEICWVITDKGLEIYQKYRYDKKKYNDIKNPQEALSNKGSLPEKKKKKKKKKKKNKNKNKKKEEKQKQESFQKKSNHSYHKISKFNGKARKIIKENLKNEEEKEIARLFMHNEFDDSYRNVEEELLQKTELEEFEKRLKCSSP